MNLPQQDDTSSAERRIIFRWKFVELRWQRWQEGGRSAATRYFMIYKKLTYGGRSARSSPCIYGNFRNLHPIYQRHVILVSPLLIHLFPVDSYDRQARFSLSCLVMPLMTAMTSNFSFTCHRKSLHIRLFSIY